MTNLSPKQLVEVIVRSLDHTAMRFAGSAKKKAKTRGTKGPNHKPRSTRGRTGKKLPRKH